MGNDRRGSSCGTLGVSSRPKRIKVHYKSASMPPWRPMFVCWTRFSVVISSATKNAKKSKNLALFFWLLLKRLSFLAECCGENFMVHSLFENI